MIGPTDFIEVRPWGDIALSVALTTEPWGLNVDGCVIAVGEQLGFGGLATAFVKGTGVDLKSALDSALGREDRHDVASATPVFVQTEGYRTAIIVATASLNAYEPPSIDGAEAAAVASCALAADHGLGRLALPLFGSGGGGLSGVDVARRMISSLRRSSPPRLSSVVLTTADRETYDALRSNTAELLDLAAPVASVDDADEVDDDDSRGVPSESVLSSLPPLAPTTKEILDTAAALALQRGTKHKRPHTSTLLFAIIEVGKAIESPTARFAHSEIAIAHGEAYQRELHLYFGGVPDIMAPRGSSAPSLTLNYVEVLRRAGSIARATMREPMLWPRHLLASLLTTEGRDGRRTGATWRLGRFGVSPIRLRGQFLGQILATTPEDDADAWKSILAPPQRIPEFSSDDVDGKDLLRAGRETAAFAALIASRDLEPPLSIGIFGDWGSGKSFFMKCVRDGVSKLSKPGAPKTERGPYFRNIEQIEFNAWHYVESNLWASLVDNIFTKLHDRLAGRVAGDDEGGSLRKDLATTGLLLVEAQAAFSLAEKEYDEAKKRFDELKIELDKRSKTLVGALARNVWEGIRVPDASREQKEAVSAARELFGDDVVSKAQDLQAALHEARAIGGRVRWVALYITRGRLLIPALVAAVSIVGVILIGPSVVEDKYRSLVELCGSVVAGILPIAAWIQARVGKAGGLFKKMDAARTAIDAEVNAAAASRAEGIASAENQVDAAKLLVADSARRVGDAKERVTEAELMVREDSVARRLAHFIEERAKGDDYRRHLGLVALIRRDFSRLSELMTKARAESEAATSSATPFVDRIVLYIDDLDRCPPEKVVEVLQAIHLLLAFKLFVVVVGVDARWIAQALARHYPHLMDPRDRSRDARIGRATPLDYLEKIFQIPYWLTPLDAERRLGMITGLLGATSTSTVVDQRGFDTPPPPGLPVPAGDERRPPSPSAATEAQATSSQKDAAPRVRLNENFGAERLAISKAEVDFIRGLAPYIARSPRRLKRFVNVYRLIKAGLDPDEFGSFLYGGAAVLPFHAVLTLLAVVTDASEGADVVLPWLASAPKTLKLAPACDQLAPLLATHPRADSDLCLGPIRHLAGLNEKATAGALRPWIDVVGRYSFRLHHVGSERAVRRKRDRVASQADA